jgi:peptidylprolyl isomerase
VPKSRPLYALLPAALMLAFCVTHACAQASAPAKARSMQEILDASKPSDWRTLDPDNTLYLELATGRVVIELAPGFAPAHVTNVRTLAHEGYWDGMSINRSQDNFVVQWGDPAEEEKDRKPLGQAQAKLPAEFTRSGQLAFHALPTATAGRRRSVLSTASRPRASPRRAPRGWRTAMARSAPAATSPPIRATAPSCMS